MRYILFSSLLFTVATSTAHAEFYPYYSGAAHIGAASVLTPQTLPNSVVPQRYYAPYGAAPNPGSAIPSPVATTSAPTTYAASTPGYIAPAPSFVAPVQATPTYQYATSRPSYVATAPQPAANAYQAPSYNYGTPAYAAPAPQVAAAPSAFNNYYQPSATSHKRPNQFYLGVDSYYDRYKEPSVNLDNRGLFGSLEYGFEHYFTPTWFMNFDGRSSYGRTAYSSVSGKIAQIVGFEFDHSLTFGYDMLYRGGRHFKPYAGLGMRYFDEQGKGEQTNLGFVGYDRRFWQFYMPVGMAFEMPAWGGFTAEPLVEVAPLLYGYGQSRFQNIGLEQLSHVQHNGYRLRTELMFRRMNDRGYGFEFGPFLRYWDINASELDTNSGVFLSYFLEPENTRLQVGISAKWLF